MFQTGDIVEVMDYDEPTRSMAWHCAYVVEVVSPRYEAGDPTREFVGKVIRGRFEGKNLAIQNKHARVKEGE